MVYQELDWIQHENVGYCFFFSFLRFHYYLGFLFVFRRFMVVALVWIWALADVPPSDRREEHLFVRRERGISIACRIV